MIPAARKSRKKMAKREGKKRSRGTPRKIKTENEEGATRITGEGKETKERKGEKSRPVTAKKAAALEEVLLTCFKGCSCATGLPDAVLSQRLAAASRHGDCVVS